MSAGAYKILFAATKDYEDLGKIFAIVGVEAKIMEDDAELLAVLREILEAKQTEYAIILMPEKFIDITKPIREKLREDGRYIPAFLFLPDIGEPKFLQLEELNELLKRIQGVTIEQIREQFKGTK